MFGFGTRILSSFTILALSATIGLSVVLECLKDTCFKSKSCLHLFFSFLFSMKSHKQMTASKRRMAVTIPVVVELASIVLDDPSTTSWQLKEKKQDRLRTL